MAEDQFFLTERFQALSRDGGLQRDKEVILAALGQELCQLWGISTDDGIKVIQGTIVARLRDLFREFSYRPRGITVEQFKLSLEVSYHFKQMPDDVEEDRDARQEWYETYLRKRGVKKGGAARTQREWVDQFAAWAAEQLEPRRLELAAQSAERAQQVRQSQLEVSGEPQSLTEAPTLTTELRDLLAAQVAAAAEIGLSDPLTTRPSAAACYVELSVRPPKDSSFREEMSLRALLKQHGHIGIRGEAGSGKSTLAKQTVARMSRELLAGDHIPAGTWLPLYVPARLLAGPGGFAERVASALAEHLAGLLMESPAATLFVEPPSGAQGWLVFVDGTDELAKGNARSSLVAALNHQSASARFRFVVLGRSIEPGLAMLDLKTYEIAPFDDWQLSEFCRGWMRAHNVSEAKAHQVLQQARNSGIYDLLKNPLLATMLCQVHAQKPGSEIPHSLLGLYESFVRHLLFKRPGQAEIRRQMKTVLEQYGTLGDQLTSWLYDNRRSVCTRVAQHVVKGFREELLETATEYVKESFAGFGSCSDIADAIDWQPLMHDLLLSTGFFVQRGPELAVMQRSLMEYLASEKEDTEEVSIYIDEPGEWYLFQMGDDLDNFTNLCLLRWAKSSAAEEANIAKRLIRNLLGPRSEYARKTYPIVQHAVAELLSYSDVPLDNEMVGHITDFYSGPHKILSDEEYLIGLGSFYRGFGFDPDGLEQDVNAILGRLGVKYGPIADLLFRRTAAGEIWSPAILDGLAWLWRTKHQSYVEQELCAFLAGEAPRKWLDAGDVYLDIGNVGMALEAARRQYLTPEHLWRSADLLLRCGELDEAQRRLSEAFQACSGWEMRCFIARTVARFGESKTAEQMLNSALQAQPLRERGLEAQIELRTFGFSELAERELRLILTGGHYHRNDSRRVSGLQQSHFGPSRLEECMHAPGCRAMQREMFSADFNSRSVSEVTTSWNFIRDYLV
ncbi:NACHT domain-containing protein [Streptomyces shenzhenensis]|uniref:NACHT domain-containing protein n=1 Tax=Streptomyces shenzhenensis TaxID=943815 RepID=UPI001F42889C|nr:hypothetical protein [Streptomyces shenzhenensis]